MKFVNAVVNRKVKKEVLRVDPETGEVHGNFSNLGYDVVKEKTEDFVIKDMKFLSVSRDFENVLGEHIGDSDFRKVLKIAGLTKWEFNIVMNGGKPHRRDTLAKFLGVAPPEVTRMMKRLSTLNLIKYEIIEGSGYKYKVYVINPRYLSSSRGFNCELIKIFSLK